METLSETPMSFSSIGKNVRCTKRYFKKGLKYKFMYLKVFIALFEDAF